MKKRAFLSAGLAAAALPTAHAAADQRSTPGPALLTVTGAIQRTNRGPIDLHFDQMMVKQKVSFDKAYAFDFPTLYAMAVTKIQATLEYDGRKHTLAGPLLADVLKQAGAPKEGKLAMRAVDGYSPQISIGDARKYGFIVAIHLDGKPMPLGGVGPLWAVYSPDRFPEMMAKPVGDRFALCPWGLYHIDVQA